jgi:Xaa-Pro dipeptidase
MIDLVELRQALHEADLDGWLLFAFKGLNPVATRVLGLSGLNTRRLFALFPREGEPVVIAHKIELQGLENFPGRVVPYARWGELNQALGHAVAGKTLGMEISPRDAVPYLDRVPHGVVQLLQSMGAKILPSGDLVSRFAARWSPQELADHHFAAEVLADVARTSLRQAIRETGALTETVL